MVNFKAFGIGYRHIAGAIIVLTSMAASALGAVWAVDEFTRQRNAVQLQELSQQVRHSAELAIDYAVITLSDFIAPSADLCQIESLSALRRQAFLRGAIKDISVLGPEGQLMCATSPVAADEIVNELILSNTYSARHPAISLQAAHSAASGLFRVVWTVGVSHSVAATLNIDTLMFDIFPPALRDDAQAEVKVGNEIVVARFGDAIDHAAMQSNWQFSASSTRYPVSVFLQVSEQSFGLWNASNWWAASLAGGLLGGLLGGLFFRVLMPPIGPTEILRKAIRDGEIVPFYQPIFDLSSRQIVGCEVLIRWIKSDGSVVFPDRFIPFAETSDLIIPMTERLIADALTSLSLVLSARPHFKVAFNIAPTHFIRPDFLDTIDRLARAAGTSATQIVLELTERTSFGDMTIAAEIAREARRRGYRISLDDTGAGHNGLGHIQDLSPSVIKIDKKFVDGVGVDPTADAIVDVLVRLARNIGATLVAEGIEHESQANALAMAGVTEGQGYLVAKPLPIDGIKAILGTGGPSEVSGKTSNPRDAA